MVPLLVVAAALALLVFCLIEFLGAPPPLLSPADVWYRFAATLTALGLLVAGSILWPRKRAPHTTDYLVPASAYSIGWLMSAFLTHHYRALVAHLRSVGLAPPLLIGAAQAVSIATTVWGFLYFVFVRSYPPPTD